MMSQANGAMMRLATSVMTTPCNGQSVLAQKRDLAHARRSCRVMQCRSLELKRIFSPAHPLRRAQGSGRQAPAIGRGTEATRRPEQPDWPAQPARFSRTRCANVENSRRRNESAALIKATARENDIVARLGGGARKGSNQVCRVIRLAQADSLQQPQPSGRPRRYPGEQTSIGKTRTKKGGFHVKPPFL
jgi:hypothetical protein